MLTSQVQHCPHQNAKLGHTRQLRKMMATAHVQADGSEIGSILQVVSRWGKKTIIGALQVALVGPTVVVVPICFRHGIATVTRQAHNIVQNGDLTVWEETIQQVMEKRSGLVYIGRVWPRQAIGATRMQNRMRPAQRNLMKILTVEKVGKQTRSVFWYGITESGRMMTVVRPIGSVAISPTPARPASPVSSRTLRGEARALIVQLENTKALQAKQSALIVMQANILQIRLQQ
jgi:hypothetical protein